MTAAISVELIDDWKEVPMDQVFMIIDAPDIGNLIWRLQQQKYNVEYPKTVLRERFKNRYWVPLSDKELEE